MRIAILSLIASGLALAAPVPKEEVKLKPATEKERDEVKNNLKMIGLAMHNHESAMGYFPGDLTEAKTKKPLLSWRVAVLPHLEEEELYKQFNLNEPWDSKTNKPLIEKLPKIFAPTRVKAKPGETFYRGFAGKGPEAGIFERKFAKLSIVSITDGTSNTFAVLDAGEPAVWTQPESDLPYDPKKELPKLGGMIDGDFYTLMCDGSVRMVKRNFNEKALRAAVTRSGGEIIDGKNLFADE